MGAIVLNTCPREKFGIVICGCISYNRVGTLAFIKGNWNAKDILENNLWPVVVRYFPSNKFVFLLMLLVIQAQKQSHFPSQHNLRIKMLKIQGSNLKTGLLGILCL